MRLFAFFFCLMLLGAAAAVVTLPEGSGASYSAFRTIVGPGPGRGGWVYHDAGKERFEFVVEGRLSIYIYRPDLSRVFVVDPQAGTATAVGIYDRRHDFTFMNVGRWPAEAEGRESLDGEQVTKYVTLDQFNRPQTYWLTDDGIPLRIVIVTGIETTELRLTNLKRGRQAAHLFEVPADIPVLPASQEK